MSTPSPTSPLFPGVFGNPEVQLNSSLHAASSWLGRHREMWCPVGCRQEGEVKETGRSSNTNLPQAKAGSNSLLLAKFDCHQSKVVDEGKI